MFITAGVSLLTSDGVVNEITSSAIIIISIGLILMLSNKNNIRQINKKDGYLIVTVGWLTMIFSGMLPYYMTDSISSFSNLIFESMSGYTATGSTIINDVESLPKSVIFWRSMTHWLGGMGIIVLAIAILPLLGIGGMQLFSAEAPGSGISGDKIHPRISATAKRLWYIYVGLTFVETLALNFAGMSIFDAINHSMSNIATGGFSTKNNSLAYWNSIPQIQYIIIFFMILAGTNYLLIYSAFIGKFKKLFNNTEFIWYLSFIAVFVLVTTLVLFFNVDLSNTEFDHPEIYGKFESSFRHAFFQIVAVITTTGFVTGDFAGWTPFLTMLFFGLMFIGASSGSTSGGIKISRHLILIKNGFLEFKKALHPNAVLPLRYNHSVVKKAVIVNILAFFMLYLILFIIGAGVLSTQGLDFSSAVGGSAASLGNVGPAIGSLGPSLTYEGLSAFAKIWCSFLMLVGRLELFTFLIIFTPYFWRKI
jgi:trk system potassium uptake protein TrkH|tara:strand:- start:9 stop:1442 length:1434 start_codon:yes stop_codon:yes gene_type:complete